MDVSRLIQVDWWQRGEIPRGGITPRIWINWGQEGCAGNDAALGVQVGRIQYRPRIQLLLIWRALTITFYR